ncbi:hypothetical protein [Sulfurimonas sp.]|uniref:hypothetical protein n=1 Tax=Sulfurimonas sp. TaxID=2022749 RepID=UPI003566B61D
MTEKKDLFMQTGKSQISTTNMLIEKLKPSIEYLTYNIKRYNVPITLVLFYSEEDISDKLHDSVRLTDVIDSIKIGDSYFNFVFLIFTDEEDSYAFVKHVEYNKLSNIDHFYYYETLQPEIYNYYNFINTYLFEIDEKKKNNDLA